MAHLLLLALLAAPGPDPATLKTARFSEAGDVQRIRDDSWRPWDPRNGARSVRFAGEGKLVVDWPAGSYPCDFTARRDGDGWALTVDCGRGPAPARWTWLRSGGVRTTVFRAAAPQMTQPVELVRFDRDFADVEHQFREAYRARSLRRLAGTWQDASWETEVVLDQDRSSLRGARALVQVTPCTPLGAEAGAAESSCLALVAGKRKLMLVEQADRLYECDWADAGAGAQFSLAKGSRIFTRVPEPAPATASR